MKRRSRYERRRRHCGSRSRRYFHRPGAAEKREQAEDRHGGEGAEHRKPPLPQEPDQQVRQLQALLPYYHRLFRRGGLFRREAVSELRGGRGSAHPYRSGPGPGDHPLRRQNLPGFRCGYPHRRPGIPGGPQGDPQAGHPGGPQAGGLPHPPHGHGEGPRHLSRHRALSPGERRGNPLWLRVPKPHFGERRLQGRHSLRPPPGF